MEHNPYFGLRELFAEPTNNVDLWINDSLHLEWLFPPRLGARPRSAPSSRLRSSPPPGASGNGRRSPPRPPPAAAARAERIRRLRNASQPFWQIPPQWDRQDYENRLRESLMQVARPPPNLGSIERSCVSRRLNSRKNPSFSQRDEHMFRCSTTSALPLQQQVHLHLQYDPQNVRLELAIEVSHFLAISILFLLFLRSFF